MKAGSAIVLILALGAVCANAQAKNDLKASLEGKGFKLAAALFDIANMTDALNKPSAVYTVLVPNDAAVQAFLQKMGLTVDDLKARPVLAKQLAAQHIILKHNVRAEEIFANGPARVVATLAGKPNNLLFRQLADKSVKVTDVHGNVANVKKHFVIDDNKTAHPVDKVLMSDNVYYDLADLCRFRKLTLSEFCHSVIYAGLNNTLYSSDLKDTLFVPNNKAFAKELSLSDGVVPSVAAVADALKYHVVPGAKELPKGFKSGQAVPTLLKGQDLKVEYEIVKPAEGDSLKVPYAKAFVVTSSGEKVEVVKANVHVGKAVVHGIGGILTAGNATAAAATKPAGRRMLSTVFSSTVSFSRRHLLGWGWGMSAGSTAEEDSAAASIANAANGGSAAYAAEQSTLGAEELSVPGDYNQVDEGVNPW